MNKSTDTVVHSFSRDLPKKNLSLKALKRSTMEKAGGRFRLLDSGKIAVYWRELGFMELIHQVAVYEPSSRFLRPDRMELVLSNEFDDSELAVSYFEALS